jgi:hypothetical protein
LAKRLNREKNIAITRKRKMDEGLRKTRRPVADDFIETPKIRSYAEDLRPENSMSDYLNNKYAFAGVVFMIIVFGLYYLYKLNEKRQQELNNLITKNKESIENINKNMDQLITSLFNKQPSEQKPKKRSRAVEEEDIPEIKVSDLECDDAVCNIP